MPEKVNPYASPAPIPHDHVPRPADPLEPLRGPSLGLLLSSGLAFSISFFLLLGLIANMPQQRRSIPDEAILLPMFLGSIPIFIGAWNMRQGTRYRWAYAAAVLASIPLLTPAIWCGVPLGIWALVVLHRKDVKAAFAAKTK